MPHHRTQPKVNTEQAITYVRSLQRPNGSFPIERSPRAKGVAPLAADLVLHAHILDLLQSFEDDATKQCAARLEKYLVGKLHTGRNLIEYGSVDTHALFTALAALYCHDLVCVDPQMIAAAVTFLVAHEIEPGGPYRGSQGEAADLATNIAISRFLHYIGGPFPKLTAFIAKQHRPPVADRYYSAIWPLWWQIEHTAGDTSSKPALTRSMFSENQVKKLPGTQQPDGSWPITYFYHDPRTEKSYGSAAVDTLLALSHLLQPAPKHSTPGTRPAAFGLARKHIRASPPLIKREVQRTFHRIALADHQNEISSLAQLFAPAIKDGIRPTSETLRTLDVANLYNWAAYTMYDTLLDAQNGIILLPAANVCLRKAVEHFHAAVNNPAFHRLVQQTYDTIDAANAWEVKHCRAQVRGGTIRIPSSLPDYGALESLHNRSLSHGLPVLGALASTGCALDSPSALDIQAAFKHYLLIRQLSDDLHDWQEDLSAGQLSYVVVCLLKDAGVKAGPHQLEPLIGRLERVFWRTTLPKAGEMVSMHAHQARKLLRSSGILTEANIIDTLVSGIASMMTRTLRERERAEALLAAYGASSEL